MIEDHVEDGTLRVWLKPSSSKEEIKGWDDARDALVVRVKEPARNDEANKALVKLIAEELDATVEIVQGETGRKKLLKVEQ